MLETNGRKHWLENITGVWGYGVKGLSSSEARPALQRLADLASRIVRETVMKTLARKAPYLFVIEWNRWSKREEQQADSAMLSSCRDITRWRTVRLSDRFFWRTILTTFWYQMPPPPTKVLGRAVHVIVAVTWQRAPMQVQALGSMSMSGP